MSLVHGTTGLRYGRDPIFFNAGLFSFVFSWWYFFCCLKSSHLSKCWKGSVEKVWKNLVLGIRTIYLALTKEMGLSNGAIRNSPLLTASNWRSVTPPSYLGCGYQAVSQLNYNLVIHSVDLHWDQMCSRELGLLRQFQVWSSWNGGSCTWEMRQEALCEFKARLGYRARPYLKNKKKEAVVCKA